MASGVSTRQKVLRLMPTSQQIMMKRWLGLRRCTLLCAFQNGEVGAMAIYGYARVSTEDQTLELQRSELSAKGASKVFAEKISGARSDRPQLAKLLKTLKAGDVVVVTKLDRLA